MPNIVAELLATLGDLLRVPKLSFYNRINMWTAGLYYAYRNLFALNLQQCAVETAFEIYELLVISEACTDPFRTRTRLSRDVVSPFPA